jgi:hypothetical protein
LFAGLKTVQGTGREVERMLFFQELLQDSYDQRLTLICQAMRHLPEDELGYDHETIVDRVVEEHKFPMVPVVLEDQVSRNDAKFEVGAKHTVVDVHIPFEGDGSMFKFYDSESPIVQFGFRQREQELITQFDVRPTEVDQLPEQIKERITFLNRYLSLLRPPVARFNKHFRNPALRELLARRDEVHKTNTATEKLRSLPIRIHKRADGIEKLIVPVQRKTVPVPEKPRPNREPQYEVQMATYESILETISLMAQMIERSPGAFTKMEEEDLRTILLVTLNSQYEWQATGETFNGYGKTDILISVEKRNAFIGECLVWKGEEYLLEKMDAQLFQYAMWRDSKTALIVFSRLKNFSQVVAKMKNTVSTHRQCVRLLKEGETDAMYLFHRHDDPDRQFHVTCMAFDVPEKKAPAGQTTERE